MLITIEVVKEDGSFVPLAEVERQMIKLVLEMNNNCTKAAKQLGIGRSTLYRKIEAFNLQSFVAELEERDRIAREEEEERIRTALQSTYDVTALCEMLKMDERTFQRKINLYGFSLHRAKLKILTNQQRAEEQRRNAVKLAEYKKAA